VLIGVSSSRPFNPCLLDENEQIPAKIWELLRRNDAFRAKVQKLNLLDAKAQDEKRRSVYHGPAWERSRALVERVAARHPFAGVALLWLVPEPLFHCEIVGWPRGKKWKRRRTVPRRFLRIGEGLTPHVKDKSWVWRDPNQLDVAAHYIVRGPEVFCTQSKFKRLRDQVNAFEEWRRYQWPFTVDHSWADAPPQFKRRFHFIWRDQFDCRSVNPLTGNRRDSPSPHETTFFWDWDLLRFRESGNLTEADLRQLFRFNELAKDYRVFAIPKTVLTKARADRMGKWLAHQLKKGSNRHGDPLKDKLLNESELLGTTGEWADWLAHRARVAVRTRKDSHFYRRCHYMTSLVDRIFPEFDIGDLLASPLHRARGKKYVPKGGQN